jgi:gamma-glutamylcyclotransferase (GGCT)/AIG2-like uncharacterized protein YtfP
VDSLFVYGIFLDAYNREAYGMHNPRYDTVMNYVTVGNHIVQAVPVSDEFGTALTGLVVDVEPNRWEDIDRLEGNYARIQVTTVTGKRAYMYAAKE